MTLYPLHTLHYIAYIMLSDATPTTRCATDSNLDYKVMSDVNAPSDTVGHFIVYLRVLSTRSATV